MRASRNSIKTRNWQRRTTANENVIFVAVPHRWIGAKKTGKSFSIRSTWKPHSAVSVFGRQKMRSMLSATRIVGRQYAVNIV